MNSHKIIDQDIIEFRDEALQFYDYLRLNNFQNTNEFISRPYCYYMSYNFAKTHGLNIDKIKNKSKYITGDFRFFMTGPDHQDGLLPHIDNFAEGISPGVINIYLKNCNNDVSTKWWKIKDGIPIWVENNGGAIPSKLSADRSPRFPVDGEFEVVEEQRFNDGDSILFRTSRWHSVHNGTDKNRIMCSFMLNPLMIWEDLVENFKHNNLIAV